LGVKKRRQEGLLLDVLLHVGQEEARVAVRAAHTVCSIGFYARTYFIISFF